MRSQDLPSLRLPGNSAPPLSSPRKSRRPSPVHSLETLEDRIAPATITINGGTAQNLGTNGTYTLDVSGGNLRVIDGGLNLLFTTPLVSVNSVLLAGEAADSGNTGNDIFNIASLGNFNASLSIVSTSGQDTVNFNGSINFGTDKNLSVDLNDPAKLADIITVSAGAALTFSADGQVSLTASRSIQLLSNSNLSTVDGDVTLIANPTHKAAGGVEGILISHASITTTGSGDLTLDGSGTQATQQLGSDVFIGVNVIDGSKLKTTGNGAISITGTGGLGSLSLSVFPAVGVWLGKAELSSNAGITIVGAADQHNRNNDHRSGVYLSGEATVQTTGAAPISITGTGGTSGHANHGIELHSGTGLGLKTAGGSITLIGAGGSDTSDFPEAGTASIYQDTSIISNGGMITLIGDHLTILNSVQAGQGDVAMRQKTPGTTLEIGPAYYHDPTWLDTDELSRVHGNTIIIGDADSGTISITEMIYSLVQTLKIDHSLRITSDGGFSANITSATGYNKLIVNGALSIEPGATLNLSSSYVPSADESFTIVENISAGITTGSFKNKLEGSTIPLNGVNKIITYAGGPDGNDVAVRAPFPAISVSSSSGSIAENSGTNLVYTFTRTGTPTGSVAAHFTLSGAASFSEPDYTVLSATGLAFDALTGIGTINFADGETTKTLTLHIQDDPVEEASESVVVTLVDGYGYTVSGAPAVATILDNDATVSVSGPPASVGESSGTGLVYTFTRTGPLDSALTIGFHLSGTATAAYGTDYTQSGADTFGGSSGTITFAAGSSTATLTFTPSADDLYEQNETAILTVVTGTNYSASGSPATGTIIDDDTAPTLSIADTSVSEGADGFSHAIFTVTLSAPSGLEAVVFFDIANGTAVAPGDYLSQALGRLTIAPGQTSKTIDILVRGDSLYERGQDETFAVHLSAPQNATLSDAEAIGTILNDDTAPAGSLLIDAKHPAVFFDANHDKITVKLTGKGAGTVVLNGGVLDGADISEIQLTGTDSKSSLSVSVAKDKLQGNGLVSIGEITVDGALASLSAKAADLAVAGFTASGPVKSIAVHDLLGGGISTGGTATDKLALTLARLVGGTSLTTAQTISSLKALSVNSEYLTAAAFGSLSISAGSLAADLHATGAVGKITIKGGHLVGALTAASFGAISITDGDLIGSLTSSTPAADLGSLPALAGVTITGGYFVGDVDVLGRIGNITVKPSKLSPGGGLSGDLSGASFGNIALTGGDLSATVISLGKIGNITVKAGQLGAGGDFRGNLSAASFGKIALTGGDFSGHLTSLVSLATLGHTPSVAGVTITGGDLTGDLRVFGALGPVTVAADKTGTGGNLTGAIVNASSIASLSVAKNIGDSIILAGGDLGSDRAFGGGDDSFAPGTIGAISIKGNAIAAIIGAGLSTTDADLKNIDDTLLGGSASVVKSLTIGGTADADSYFAAGLFKANPKVDGAPVDFATDPRFKTI